MNTENRDSRHLTEKEISQWLVEGPEHSVSQHVQDCWTCQAELAEAQAPLAAFRSALVEWSEAQTSQSVNLQTTVVRNERLWGRRLWLPAASFALAALLLVGYAKIPISLHGNSIGQQPVVTASDTTDSDEALLNQVDTEVSEAVPDAMAPLTDLVSWDASEGSASRAATTEKHVARKTSTRPAIAKAPVDVKD
jgi:hypothetical protein